MRRIWRWFPGLLLIAFAVIFFGLVYTKKADLPLKSFAESRVKAFAETVNLNYKQPELIYDYLDLDYQKNFSKDRFVEAFTKERSYPYLTPLWINYKRIEMAPNNLSGIGIFDQAARMKGMIYEVPFVYQNFRYRMIAFTEFPDGSYLEKFDHIPNYLIHGWD